MGAAQPMPKTTAQLKQEAENDALLKEIEGSNQAYQAELLKRFKDTGTLPSAGEAERMRAAKAGVLERAQAPTQAEADKAAAKAMQPLDMADIVLRAAGRVKTTTGYAGSFLTGPAENPVDRAARKFSQEKLILDAAKLRGLK